MNCWLETDGVSSHSPSVSSSIGKEQTPMRLQQLRYALSRGDCDIERWIQFFCVCPRKNITHPSKRFVTPSDPVNLPKVIWLPRLVRRLLKHKKRIFLSIATNLVARYSWDLREVLRIQKRVSSTRPREGNREHGCQSRPSHGLENIHVRWAFPTTKNLEKYRNWLRFDATNF